MPNERLLRLHLRYFRRGAKHHVFRRIAALCFVKRARSWLSQRTSARERKLQKSRRKKSRRSVRSLCRNGGNGLRYVQVFNCFCFFLECVLEFRLALPRFNCSVFRALHLLRLTLQRAPKTSHSHWYRRRWQPATIGAIQSLQVYSFSTLTRIAFCAIPLPCYHSCSSLYNNPSQRRAGSPHQKDTDPIYCHP